MLASVTEASDPAAMLRATQALWGEAEPRGNRHWMCIARVDAARASIRLGEDADVPGLLGDASEIARAMGATRLLDQIAALERGELAASG